MKGVTGIIEDKQNNKFYIEIPKKHIETGLLEVGKKYRVELFSLQKEKNAAGGI